MTVDLKQDDCHDGSACSDVAELSADALILARVLRHLSEAKSGLAFAQKVVDDIAEAFSQLENEPSSPSLAMIVRVKSPGYQVEAVSSAPSLMFECDVTHILEHICEGYVSGQMHLNEIQGWENFKENWRGIGQYLLISQRPVGEERSLVLCCGERPFSAHAQTLFCHMAHAAHEADARIQSERALTRRESAIRQAQRFEALGTVASGIAHEINTPVQFVGDNLRFLKQSLDELLPLLENLGEMGERREFLRRELPEALAESLAGVEQIGRIVSSMRGLSHPGSKTFEPTDINATLHNAVTLCRLELKNNADIFFDLQPSLPLVDAQVNSLSQVWVNLLVNAAHALQDALAKGGPRGFIVVRTRCEKPEEVIVEVEDTGLGIQQEDMERIFDPFFTTKDVGKGTGQGLAIVYDIVVNRHKGRVDVLSTPGDGTCFSLVLPVRQDVEV